MGCAISHHLGRVGHWAEQAVSEGLIAIHFTNAVSQHWVRALRWRRGGLSPTPSRSGFRGGTRTSGPIVLDFATSAIAQGKGARRLQRQKAHTPEARAHDHEGFRPPTRRAVEPVNGRTGALTTIAAAQ